MKFFYMLSAAPLLFIFSSRLYGQTDPGFKRFSFQAGINISDMNFNKGEPPPAVPVKASWQTGITLGFLVRVPLAGNLFLQPEYAYTERQGSDGSISTNYKLDYFSLPVLLNYRCTPVVSLLAGPQVELLVHATAKNAGVSSNITHDTEERSIAATAGIEVTIKKILFVSARYLQGFNHIGIGQRSSVKEFKYQAVNLTAGIRF